MSVRSLQTFSHDLVKVSGKTQYLLGFIDSPPPVQGGGQIQKILFFAIIMVK